MTWKLSNTWGRLSLLQSVGAADTTIYVSAADGALLPTLGVTDQAPAVLFDSTYREVVYISAISGGTLTVSRGQESTSARAWAAGTILVHTPTAAVLQAVLNIATSTAYTGTTTNIGDAYTLNVGAGNSIPSLSEGEEVILHISASNGGPATLVVTNGTTSTTSKNIRHQDDQPLEAGDLDDHWYGRVIFSTNHDAWILTSQTSHQLHATQINDGPLAAVNRHRNGRLDFWNNGTSFATPASGTETADGWLAEYDGTIGTFTVNRQDFTLGQTTVEGDPKHWLRWDQSAAGSGSTYRRFKVKLPGVHWRNGEQITRRLWLKADTARTVTGKIIQHFGTGGAPSADVEVSSSVFSVTTAWQSFSVSPTLTSITGKTLGSNADDALWLVLELPLNVTMTIDVANDDIRPGALVGLQDFAFPVPWWLGGTGGSWESSADFVTGLGLITTGNFAATFATTYLDLNALEALDATAGYLVKTAANTYARRTFAVDTGMTIANADGQAGNTTIGLDTALDNYVADPLSVGELASITANFGTAAFKNTGTSGDAVPLLNTANTFSAAQAISLTAAGTAETLTSTDAGATGGPDLVLHRDSASPTANDVLSRVFFRGEDSVSTATDYATIEASVVDATDASEDGKLVLKVLVAGVDTTHITMVGGQVQIPAGSAATPALSTPGDTNTGIYFPAADQLGISAGGAVRGIFGNNWLLMYGPVFCQSGSAGAPSYSFDGDTNLGFYRIGADNLGLSLNGALALDFSTSRVLLSSGIDVVLNSATGPSSAYSLGFRGAPLGNGGAAANSAYTFVLADAGCTIYHDEATARTYTIPANASVAYPVGTVIVIDNTGNSGAAGGITLAITSDTLRRGDGTSGTGSRTIPASAVAAIRKVAATLWVITGTFS